MEPKLESEAIPSLIGDILIGETGSVPAILPSYTLIGQLCLAGLIDKIVSFRVVVVEDLLELLVFLDDLQTDDGIGLEGWIGVDEEVVNDEIEIAFPVGLQDGRVVCLASVMLLHMLGLFLDPGEGAFVQGVRSGSLHTAYISATAFFALFSQGILKEALDATIDLSYILIAASKLDRISIDPEVPIAIDDLSIIYLVGVVCFGEDVLYHRAGVYDALAHTIVLEGNQVVVFVVEAGGVQIVESFIQTLDLARFTTMFWVEALRGGCMIVLGAIFRGLVLYISWFIETMDNFSSLIQFMPVLLGEGSCDEFIPFGVGDFLIQEFISDAVLVFLDDVREQFFGLGEAVVRGLRSCSLLAAGRRFSFRVFGFCWSEVGQVFLPVHKNIFQKQKLSFTITHWLI